MLRRQRRRGGNLRENVEQPRPLERLDQEAVHAGAKAGHAILVEGTRSLRSCEIAEGIVCIGDEG